MKLNGHNAHITKWSYSNVFFHHAQISHLVYPRMPTFGGSPVALWRSWEKNCIIISMQNFMGNPFFASNRVSFHSASPFIVIEKLKFIPGTKSSGTSFVQNANRHGFRHVKWLPCLFLMNMIIGCWKLIRRRPFSRVSPFLLLLNSRFRMKDTKD